MSKEEASAFAPVNIALVKYWGKRNEELNLPVTSSLSISLGNYGATTSVKIIDAPVDQVLLDNQFVPNTDSFYTRVVKFLELIRNKFNLGNMRFQVKTHSNLPIAAGLASSASGFAALSLALNKLFAKNLSLEELSKLARRGSGSAARSVYQGFALWQAGQSPDGQDSFAYPINYTWPKLRIGLLIFNATKKATSSTQAMQATTKTCPFYKLWPQIVDEHLQIMLTAIKNHDFITLGSIAETNALYMHSMMQATIPPTIYANEHTLQCIKKIWELRSLGLNIYFTQDAGPNLKLIYLDEDSSLIKQHFAAYQLIEIDVFQGL
jgi:diphosphomevalonate decarboxylase